MAAQTKTRLKKAPKYRHFRISKKIKHPVKLPSVIPLFKQSLLVLWKNRKLFGGILLVYIFLNVVLVRGIGSGLDLTQLKYSFQQFSHGNYGQILTGLSLFSVLLTSAGTTNSQTGNAYQTLLLVLISLALIWGLRKVSGNKKPAALRIRDAFYQGMYPLVPVFIVLLVISLQLLPMLISGSVYGLVINNGVAVTALEKFFWALTFFLFSLLSLYMITSSIFALYIVTLPDMTPLKALRSARQLVLNRRWTIMRKILFLPLALLVLSGVVMVPIVLFITPAAEWLFFVFTVVGIAVIHSYMYTLYRELING